MNDNLECPNPMLREASTTTAFALVLSRNHVSILDAIARNERTASGSAERLWVPTAGGLRNRGLIEHRHSPDFNGLTGQVGVSGINAVYRLTKAGWLMHDLLAEAGMVVAVKKQRRLVA